MTAQIEEPDFVREEREAWSRKSPKVMGDSTSSSIRRIPESTLQSQPPSYNRPSYQNPSIVFQPPRQSSEVPPQPRKQSKQILPLREFAPAPQETNIEERPKTSRGPSSYDEEDVSMRSSEDSVDTATRQATRRSKFVEGSLTERSAAVASSWYDHDSISEASIDSDTTPRASKDTRESGSFESNDSKPLPITPVTVKSKKLFKLKSSVKSSEDGEEQQAMPKKKGLRKSLSTWNFHNLGDKMKIFGSSTNDLTPKAIKPEKDRYTSSKTPARDDLDERKRKAEEEYAQQFGLKKQKSNNGIANLPQQSQASIATKPSSLKRRTASASSRTPSSSYRNRVSSSNTSYSFASDSSSDLDNSKRPSREELEKENQELRKMSRDRPSTQHDAHRSSVHLPLHQEFAGENIPRLSQENFAQGHKLRLSPGKKMGRRGEDVPPMPRLSREVFGSLENGRNTRSNIDRKGMLPRPVSMILEEEESRETEAVHSAKLKMSPVREQWEWPEDVF
jgi:hypothetical protein